MALGPYGYRWFRGRRTPSAELSAPWWKGGVVYQIYPRSFADTNGDGVGDLEGIRRHLDHLAWLGVDAIWLSPFYRSPMADFGYDVSDYCDVDPLFGTLDDFDRLLADAHARGIRVVIDWVPNHTSDQHPWFVESPIGRATTPKRDWYVWRDRDPTAAAEQLDRAPSAAAPAWTFDPPTGQWYLHLFLPEQPDLNWREPGGRGGHARRVAVLARPRRRRLPHRRHPRHRQGRRTCPTTRRALAASPSRPSTTTRRPTCCCARIRAVLDAYDGDRMMVGEVYLLDTALVAKYYGDGDELHLVVQLPAAAARRGNAGKWARADREVQDVVEPHGWPTWVLSNHDNPRHRTRYGSEARARAAAVLLLTLRGHAVPLRRRGARRCTTRRADDRGASTPAGATVPGAAAVDDGAWSRLAGTAVAALRRRRR